MAKYTNADQLRDELDDILSTYFDDVILAANAGCEEVAKYAKGRLKDVSPRSEALDAVHYADGWAVQKEKERMGMVFRIWNHYKPGLVHLLEYGHQFRNGGRAKAIPHVSIVQEECEKIIGEKIEMKVRKIAE